MRRIALFVIVAAVVFTLIPARADAIRVGDGVVIVPVIGRFPGASGTQWRTDVFIANPYSPSDAVTLKFYVAGGPTLQFSTTIGLFCSVAFKDIVLNTFGLENASGQLEIHSTYSVLEARARIYNNGNAAGEFGQNVPGLGISSLRTQAFMYGLSGTSGNRLNVGVANPNDTELQATLRITDKFNQVLLIEVVNVGAHQTVQINDVFTRFGIPPQADVQVQFNTASQVLFGYASEVRNDTGDAIFVFGTSPNVL
jgi:hypothetical protein